MPRVDTVFFYISGHGLGHASRQSAIINSLWAIRPDVQVVVRTSAPRWLFDRTLTHPCLFIPGESDTGIVQIDSLHMDTAATTQRAWEFHRTLSARAETEARLLERHGATLVAGDIPPLAFAAAAAANLPAVGIGNFTWDWIYEHYPDLLLETPELIPCIQQAYSSADVAWRLPMAGGFATFSRIIDAPLVARHAGLAPAETRDTLQLPDDRPLVLLSFGQYGIDAINWHELSKQGGLSVIVTRDPLNTGPTLPAGLSRDLVFEIDVAAIMERGVQYEDLVATVDVVLTKPGYSIIAECAANDTALLYTSRGNFAEYPILVNAMPHLLRCAYIEHADLFGGRWLGTVSQLLDQPTPSRQATNGAEVIAHGLAQYLGRSAQQPVDRNQ
jgi:L-arabinokinase